MPTLKEDEEDDPWGKVGGNAVNEKPRLNREKCSAKKGFDPLTHKSHLWHALEGLDRYPKYLARWDENDMDSLEQALEQKLELVREQRKSVVQLRESLHKLVDELVSKSGDRFYDLVQGPKNWEDVRNNILDPKMAKAIFKSNMFRGKSGPSLADVISGEAVVDLDVGQLKVVMDEEMFDVFSFPLLKPEFCALLREYIDTVRSLWKDDDYAGLGLGLRPFDLDHVGLKWVNDLLFHLVIRPISQHLFQSSETTAQLDWRQGFVAAYKPNPDTSKPRTGLVTHTDDSDVTLNIGLGKDFEGGNVEFSGLRGSDEAGQLVGSFKPVEGTAIIHAGRHFHDVTQVTKGGRYALIIWARSWGGVRKQSCPCCWLNRRLGNSCVCGAQWN